MKRSTTCWAILFLSSAALQADVITVGQPPITGTGNCDPFGCPTLFSLGTYQQVFTSSAFPTTEVISQISFGDTAVLNFGQPASGNFTLSLSYTSAPPGGLSTQNPNNNVVADSQVFYSGSLPAISASPGPRYLVFSGSPFTYNPADGDLLLTVTVSGEKDNRPSLYLDIAQNTLATSAVYFGTNGVNSPQNDPGLVTTFQVTPVSTSVPEPYTAWLTLGGATLLAGWRRPSRRT